MFPYVAEKMSADHQLTLVRRQKTVPERNRFQQLSNRQRVRETRLTLWGVH